MAEQYGNAEGVAKAANLLLGLPAEESGGQPAVPDAKPDDVEQPAPAPEGASAPGESPSLEDLAAQLLADPEPDPQAPGETPKPNSLETLAEIAGMEVADLYQIAVPMADGGEPITVGQLKDIAQSRATFDQERDAFETNRISQESTMLRARQELQQLVAAIGADKLTPEAQQLLRDQQAAYLQEQQKEILRMRPEWANPEQGKAAQEQISATLEAYGFTPAERQGMADARILKAFHDLGSLLARVEAANARMQELRGDPKPATPRGRSAPKVPDSQQIIDQAKGAALPRDKTSAVAALIAKGAARQ